MSETRRRDNPQSGVGKMTYKDPRVIGIVYGLVVAQFERQQKKFMKKIPKHIKGHIPEHLRVHVVCIVAFPGQLHVRFREGSWAVYDLSREITSGKWQGS